MAILDFDEGELARALASYSCSCTWIWLYMDLCVTRLSKPRKNANARVSES